MRFAFWAPTGESVLNERVAYTSCHHSIDKQFSSIKINKLRWPIFYHVICSICACRAQSNRSPSLLLCRPACISLYKAISETFTCYMSLGFPISTSLERIYTHANKQTTDNVACNFRPKSNRKKYFLFIDKNFYSCQTQLQSPFANKPEKCWWPTHKKNRRDVPNEIKSGPIIW